MTTGERVMLAECLMRLLPESFVICFSDEQDAAKKRIETAAIKTEKFLSFIKKYPFRFSNNKPASVTF